VPKPRPNKLKVVTAGRRSYIDVHPARGMDLTPNPSSKDVDCVMLASGVDLKVVQRLLKDWS
jgi:hypothetical protein